MSDQKINRCGGKPQLGLIPAGILRGVARVFGYGVKKYARGNWYLASLSDGAGERYLSATLRHLAAMQRPDGLVDLASLSAKDDESGLPHIDHAICSLIMLRGILQKDGLPDDPGEGNEPPRQRPATGEY